MKASFAIRSLAAWLTRAVGPLRNRQSVQVTHSALSMHNEPEITSGWDYRPRRINRREAAFDRGGSGTSTAESSSPSTPNENDDVWFDFINREPTVEHTSSIGPLSGDARKLPEYDQSPIDNNGVAKE